ncbi:hypothetical protein C7S20_10060 [Christiangramia fulva]|uniref:Host attachment protein n=1 Tax=Christiangramia fulva TaxID=2126553 RepID=A0A2R3Z5N1_9FLAO|nr:hypothetical protein [Christiangramia fulva]AVR45581.1 hypothetical protein C7S20_10060 [Christiangramia fulva]
MKKIGIWIDRKNAKIISISEEEERLNTISSHLHFFKHKGFSRAAMKWGGPQDVLSAKTIEEKEKNHLNTYFDEVIEAVRKAEAIAVFGPGEIPRMFTHRLERKNKILWTRLKTVEKTDKLSDKQFKAHVRNFYRWGSV